ncbi:hypothetical protein BHF68_10375 [Desulfuribacillus alkaliarsenatis]|uniref:Uncharacterized protein n=1 Tax=Desulfuribacillus alkaliarsenatis TaxID=766136 RepID=A0A1E5G105_9FIRM|nr:hypothetical protein BHF68_10375 [Desulfuribacillus alkaliarsenatis]
MMSAHYKFFLKPERKPERKIVSIDKTLLNSRGATFFNVDWANEDAMNYICNDCGYIFWFADYDKHKKEQDEYAVQENECPNCYSKIDPKDTRCKNCGHII